MLLRGLLLLLASYRLHLELLWPSHQLAEHARHLAAAPAAETRQGGPDLAPHKAQILHGPDLGSSSGGLRCLLIAAADRMLALNTWSYTRQSPDSLRAPYKERLQFRALTGGSTLQAYRECKGALATTFRAV